eukprot:CAMPEP_0178987156 /NCGR_PEP_ID=MMETSP0795-20121207/3106_1 /TAXON_ID=88552 /ORGANISM="Amoebophrya sp., Strain Ameob2" /LENGTH=831 /DNA_ID=CAMNT_0020678303 /DNA_START=103 /DNA_END=2598 /DNA_ORIENTATION=-
MDVELDDGPDAVSVQHWTEDFSGESVSPPRRLGHALPHNFWYPRSTEVRCSRLHTNFDIDYLTSGAKIGYVLCCVLAFCLVARKSTSSRGAASSSRRRAASSNSTPFPTSTRTDAGDAVTCAPPTPSQNRLHNNPAKAGACTKKFIRKARDGHHYHDPADESSLAHSPGIEIMVEDEEPQDGSGTTKSATSSTSTLKAGLDMHASTSTTTSITSAKSSVAPCAETRAKRPREYHLDYGRILAVACVVTEHCGSREYSRRNVGFVLHWVLPFLYVISGYCFSLSKAGWCAYSSRLALLFCVGTGLNWLADVANGVYDATWKNTIYQFAFVVMLLGMAVVSGPLRWQLAEYEKERNYATEVAAVEQTRTTERISATIIGADVGEDDIIAPAGGGSAGGLGGEREEQAKTIDQRSGKSDLGGTNRNEPQRKLFNDGLSLHIVCVLKQNAEQSVLVRGAITAASTASAGTSTADLASLELTKSIGVVEDVALAQVVLHSRDGPVVPLSLESDASTRTGSKDSSSISTASASLAGQTVGLEPASASAHHQRKNEDDGTASTSAPHRVPVVLPHHSETRSRGRHWLVFVGYLGCGVLCMATYLAGEQGAGGQDGLVKIKTGEDITEDVFGHTAIMGTELFLFCALCSLAVLRDTARAPTSMWTIVGFLYLPRAFLPYKEVGFLHLLRLYTFGLYVAKVPLRSSLRIGRYTTDLVFRQYWPLVFVFLVWLALPTSYGRCDLYPGMETLHRLRFYLSEGLIITWFLAGAMVCTDPLNLLPALNKWALLAYTSHEALRRVTPAPASSLSLHWLMPGIFLWQRLCGSGARARKSPAATLPE